MILICTKIHETKLNLVQPIDIILLENELFLKYSSLNFILKSYVKVLSCSEIY